MGKGTRDSIGRPTHRSLSAARGGHLAADAGRWELQKRTMRKHAITVAWCCVILTVGRPPKSARAQATSPPATNRSADIRANFRQLEIGQSRQEVLAILGLPAMDERTAMGSSFEDQETYPLDAGETLFLYFKHDRETWRLKCAVIGSGVIHERFRTGSGIPADVLRQMEQARTNAPHNAIHATRRPCGAAAVSPDGGRWGTNR